LALDIVLKNPGEPTSFNADWRLSVEVNGTIIFRDLKPHLVGDATATFRTNAMPTGGQASETLWFKIPEGFKADAKLELTLTTMRGQRLTAPWPHD
jgi:hypothetical protein